MSICEIVSARGITLGPASRVFALVDCAELCTVRRTRSSLEAAGSSACVGLPTISYRISCLLIAFEFFAYVQQIISSITRICRCIYSPVQMVSVFPVCPFSSGIVAAILFTGDMELAFSVRRYCLINALWLLATMCVTVLSVS
jgi:hypothetical protein